MYFSKIFCALGCHSGCIICACVMICCRKFFRLGICISCSHVNRSRSRNWAWFHSASNFLLFERSQYRLDVGLKSLDVSSRYSERTSWVWHKPDSIAPPIQLPTLLASLRVVCRWCQNHHFQNAGTSARVYFIDGTCSHVLCTVINAHRMRFSSSEVGSTTSRENAFRWYKGWEV